SYKKTDTFIDSSYIDRLLDWNNGSVWYKQQPKEGNQGFRDNDTVSLEMNCDKHTLTFFVNDIQQPVYITGINEIWAALAQFFK
ncbi:MAG: hypothetical protein EZS28_041587, partial [Streblomastix strix]